MLTCLELHLHPNRPPSEESLRKVRAVVGVLRVEDARRVVFLWRTTEEFDRILNAVHDALDGSATFDRTYTTAEEQ